MKYLELSIKGLREKNKELYNKIIKEFNYDLVIFIAKGSYLIGYDLAMFNNCPLLEIYATRKGSKLKKIIKPLFKIIPKNILIKLRKKEMKSNYHVKKNDRKVSFDIKKYNLYKKSKNILLVDDSIDSGNSIYFTKKVISNFFDQANIKIAVFNVMNKSIIKSDFNLYNDTMICGPWSNDSQESNVYTKMYYKWKSKVK